MLTPGDTAAGRGRERALGKKERRKEGRKGMKKRWGGRKTSMRHIRLVKAEETKPEERCKEGREGGA